MSGKIVNGILLAALLATLAANWALRPRPSQPNLEFLPEMVRTPRYNAYSENPVFADGKTLQAPPEGTIARGLPPLHFKATPEDAVRAGTALQSPLQPASALPVMSCCTAAAGDMNAGAHAGMDMSIPGTGPLPPQSGMEMQQGQAGAMDCCQEMPAEAQGGPAAVPGCCAAMKAAQAAQAAQARAEARGAVVFAQFCQHCHGVSGKGDGPVVARGYPAPPSLFAENAKNMKDGQMFHVITYGQKNMPGHAAQISREDRWNVIAYLRAWQAQPPLEPTAVASVAPSAVPPPPATVPSSTGGRP